MLASKLIKELEKAIKEHGDIKVVGYGDWPVVSVNYAEPCPDIDDHNHTWPAVLYINTDH